MVACVKLNVTSKTRSKVVTAALPHLFVQRKGPGLSSPPSGQMALEIPQGAGPRADGAEAWVSCLIKPMTS